MILTESIFTIGRLADLVLGLLDSESNFFSMQHCQTRVFLPNFGSFCCVSKTLYYHGASFRPAVKMGTDKLLE